MSNAKQILVVDDHFEVQEFLRSMLAVANQEYQMVGVPSAEEAYLELRRRPFDLLITDLRLPGKSGYELVKQARQRWPALPVMVITGYASAEGRQEAADLEVNDYFQKPLEPSALLASIRRALESSTDGGAAPAQPEPTEPAPLVTRPVPDAAPAIATAIDRCLHNLQADTGAAEVALATLTGQIMSAAGTQTGMDVSRLARIVAPGLEHSFALAAELDSAEPNAIQYQAGKRHDLYAANVGRHHFLMLVVDTQARRGRIGTVWVFTQRAIKQLDGLLRELPATSTPTPPVQALPETGPLATPPSGDSAQPAAATVEEGVADPLIDLLTGTEQENLVDLDDFWAEALAEGKAGAGGAGLSFEEALQQGLIPPQFGNANGES